jgi:hypothetical protein
MHITYKGPSADLDIGVAYIVRGETVEVSDELGESLIESGDFVAAKSPKKSTPEVEK